MSLGKKLTMVWDLDRAIFHCLWLSVAVLRELFSLLHQSVVMWIVTKHTIVVPGSQDFCQIVLIICEHESLKFVGLDFLGGLDQKFELDLKIEKDQLEQQLPS